MNEEKPQSRQTRSLENAQFVEVQVRPAEPLREVSSQQQTRAIEVRLCGGRSVVVEPAMSAGSGQPQPLPAFLRTSGG